MYYEMNDKDIIYDIIRIESGKDPINKVNFKGILNNIFSVTCFNCNNPTGFDKKIHYYYFNDHPPRINICIDCVKSLIG